VSLGVVLDIPYYTGASTNTDTRWDVSIGGHGYVIDTQLLSEFGRQTVSMIRQQSDTSNKPGEASLNPEGLWRRSVESWHHGAGQTWYDKPDSDPFRFRSSKGVDPWTRYGLSLLPDTSLLQAAAGTNQQLAVGGGRLYASDGTTVRVTGVGNTTFATATGTPGAAVTGLASDGTTVYAGFGASGVYTATGTAMSSVYTGTAGIVRYVLGRLIVASGKAIYNVTAAGAITGGTVLLDHPNTGWTWTDAGEGLGWIYLSGYAGDKSLIYKTQIKDDGTGLAVATVAAPLPDGELAQSVTGYLGFIVIGTDKGIRFAVPQGDGNLSIGSLIPTGLPVLCAEGQDRFVWYGLSNYDTTSTGLGRLDLQNFTDNQTPAYASDLMATAQGAVTSVVTYLTDRVFAVSGSGVWMETASKVPTGTFTTGRVTYGIPDSKTLVDIDVRHDPLPAAAEIVISLTLDAGTPFVVGRSDLDGSSVSTPGAFSVNQARGAYLEITATLNGDLTLRRVTLQSDPSAQRTTIYQVPLLLFDRVQLPGGVEADVDVQAEFTYLTGLMNTRQVVTYQEADDAYRVVLDDYTWKPDKRGPDFWDGTFVARLKGV